MGNAVRLAVQRCTDDELARTLEHADAIIAASRVDDHAGIMTATSRFFDHIIDDTDNVAFIKVMHEAELAIRRNLAGWHPFVECPIRRTEGYVAVPGCRGRTRRRRAPRRSCATCTAWPDPPLCASSAVDTVDRVGHIELRDLDDDDLDAIFEMMRDPRGRRDGRVHGGRS